MKPAIVMTAFGTSVPEARKVFNYIDSKVKAQYPGYAIHWAFTSSFIRRKLKKQGIETKSPQAVVNSLRKEGVCSAVFQSLHVVPGQEFEEINALDTVGLKVSVGKALLSCDTDIDKVIDALAEDIRAESANVIVCHGNARHPRFNKQLLTFAEKIESKYTDVFVCSVEGQPGIAKLQNASSVAAEKGSVNFIPLMIVAGVHIVNDVAGDEPDSWQNVVGADENFHATPLGYNNKIIDVYIEHLGEALRNLEH